MFRCLKSFTRCQKRLFSIILILILSWLYFSKNEKFEKLLNINKIKAKRRSNKQQYLSEHDHIDYPVEPKNIPFETELGYGDENDNIDNSIDEDFDAGQISQSKIDMQENYKQSNIDDAFPEPKLGIAGTWRNEMIKFNSKQEEIIDEFKYAWNAYRNGAWGKDTLKPKSKSYETWFDMGLTILDCLDNLVLFNLNDEYEEARNWVQNELSFDSNIDYVNLFECTIRVLGGLLSAHTLTADPIYLDKSKDIGDRLLSAWSASKTDIPLSDINPYRRKARPPRWGSDSSTSEVSTVQLEFRELSLIANDPKYSIPARKTSKHLSKLVNHQPNNHFVQLYINPHTGSMSRGTITFGARTDSYYEYLLKQWIQSNGNPNDEFLLDDYIKAMEDLRNKLIDTTNGNLKLTFVAELVNGKKHPKMDHLVCFLPGTLALGYYFNQKSHVGRKGRIPDWHLELAEELGRTCSYFYSFETGLPPEICYFDTSEGSEKEIYAKPNDSFSLLRPEAIEAWFYLWRVTKKQIYRDYGWKYIKSLQKFARLDNGRGYASFNNVHLPNGGHRDKMESFFLAETLKYAFLLFSDDEDLLPLDKYVFNTEAHPILIRSMGNENMFAR